MSNRLTSDIIISKMPTNCCVFLRKKKDKREDAGEVIHFFRFLGDENCGFDRYFSVMQETRVCSKHFKSDHESNRNNPPKASEKSGAVF